MNKRLAAPVLMLALCAVCGGGALLASNMVLVLNYPLTGPATVGGRGTGMNTISLPYRRAPGINNAYDLMLDIGSGSIAPVKSVSRFRENLDAFETYTGRMGSPSLVPFPLVAGEGLFVQMATNVNYVIVGTEDTAVTIPLEAPGGGSASGKNLLAPPYNTTATDALGLARDIRGPEPPIRREQHLEVHRYYQQLLRLHPTPPGGWVALWELSPRPR